MSKRDTEIKDAIWWWANMPNAMRYGWIVELHKIWKESKCKSRKK